MPSLFEMPVEKLKFVGEKRGALYRKLGISTIGELIYFFPKRYEDWSNISSVFSAVVGEYCCLKLTVYDDAQNTCISSGRILTTCSAGDDTGVTKLVFFNNPYIKDKLKENSEYYVYGKLQESYGRKEMIAPVLLSTKEKLGFLPVYALTSSLTSRMIRVNMKTALEMIPEKIKDPIPDEYLKRYSLTDLKTALQNIHFPNDMREATMARKRLVFEELLVLNLGLRAVRSNKKKVTNYRLKKDYTKEYLDSLDFSPTSAQIKAIEDCVREMINSENPLNRLLQGDVGSGKTLVATALCHSIVKNGYQCAFIAPTEILAIQHYNNISRQFEKSGITTALLIGATTQKEKKRIKESLLNGQTDFVIGTHALLTENVKFKK